LGSSTCSAGRSQIARLTLGVGILLIVISLAIVANETHRAWQGAARA